MYNRRAIRFYSDDRAKACPFCGGKDNVKVFEYEREVGVRYSVVCLDCMAELDLGYAQQPSTAINAWNKRKNEV